MLAGKCYPPRQAHLQLAEKEGREGGHGDQLMVSGERDMQLTDDKAVASTGGLLYSDRLTRVPTHLEVLEEASHGVGRRGLGEAVVREGVRALEAGAPRACSEWQLALLWCRVAVADQGLEVARLRAAQGATQGGRVPCGSRARSWVMSLPTSGCI